MSSLANLSVTVATMDRPEALARCLDALLGGDRLPSEIIVVDQGQNGSGRAVASARRSSEVSLVYLPQDRRGLSASRNLGLAHACSAYVAMTDDDCVPDTAWVAEIERAFDQPDAPDAVAGRILPFGPDSPGLHMVSPRESTTRIDFAGAALPWLVGSGGNFAIKRDWYSRIGGCDERLGAGSPGQSAEDMDLFYRLLRAGARLRYEPAVVVYHERQNTARRLASRWSYGYGIGAFAGIRLGRADLYALYVLARWLVGHVGALIGALIRRESFQVRQRLLSLTGTLRGLLYGLRATAQSRAGGLGSV